MVERLGVFLACYDRAGIVGRCEARVSVTRRRPAPPSRLGRAGTGAGHADHQVQRAPDEHAQARDRDDVQGEVRAEVHPGQADRGGTAQGRTFHQLLKYGATRAVIAKITMAWPEGKLSPWAAELPRKITSGSVSAGRARCTNALAPASSHGFSSVAAARAAARRSLLRSAAAAATRGRAPITPGNWTVHIGGFSHPGQ